MGGTYTETVSEPFSTKTNSALYMSGVTWNGNITINGVSNFSIIIENSTINGSLTSAAATNSTNSAQIKGTVITGAARFDYYNVEGGIYNDQVQGLGFATFNNIEINYTGTS